MTEIWRDIKDYEGLYQVSNLGRVKSLKRSYIRKEGVSRTIPEKFLKPGKLANGYLQVILCKNSRHSNKLMHRLVAEAFLSNPNNLPQVNHKNEDKTDNRVDNLEWCTAKYNNNYGTIRERIGIANSKTVYQYSIDGQFIKEWISCHEVERELGFTNTAIRNCALGYSNSSYGYIWRY